MVNYKTDAKRLSKFLSQQGLTALFNHNMKKHGRLDVKTIQELVEWMYMFNHPIRQVFLFAFYWKGTKEGKKYWGKHSKDWRKYLNRKNTI